MIRNMTDINPQHWLRRKGYKSHRLCGFSPCFVSFQVGPSDGAIKTKVLL